MNKEKKYTSCSKCLEDALGIQIGESDTKWEELGNDRPQCGQCLDAVKQRLNITDDSHIES